MNRSIFFFTLFLVFNSAVFAQVGIIADNSIPDINSTPRELMTPRLDNAQQHVKDSSSFFIGQKYGGGTIFYIDGTKQHGLIAAPSDQSKGAPWGCFGTPINGTYERVGCG